MSRSSAGFTMVGMVIAILIGSILTSIALSGLSNARAGSTVRGARTTYEPLHARARAHAIERGRVQSLEASSVGSNINNTGPSVDASGACDEADPFNCGDPGPAGPCGSYLPLIHHGGPYLRIQSGGVGQGILLVDGTLGVRGDAILNNASRVRSISGAGSISRQS